MGYVFGEAVFDGFGAIFGRRMVDRLQNSLVKLK